MRTTTWRRWSGTALALLVLLVPMRASAIDVTELLARARQALEPGTDMRAGFDFTIANARGESVHWTGVYYRRSVPDSRIRLLFDSPLDLRGTDVVVRRATDGISRTRIYLPGLRREREIDADMRGESFLGTDFNYEDLGLQHLDFQQHTLVGEEELDGRACYRLESVPDRGWWYGKIVRSIDTKTFLPRRTEYYDRSGVLWKVRTFNDVKTVNGFPTATRIAMQTVPTGTSTTITLSDIQYNTKLADVLFEQRP